MRQEYKQKKIFSSGSPLTLSTLLDVIVALLITFLLKPYGVEVITAYALSTTILIALSSLFSGLVPATISFLARTSSDKKSSTQTVLYSAVVVSIVMGFVLFGLFDIIQYIYIKLCNPGPIIAQHTIDYQGIIHWSIPLASLTTIFSALFIFNQKTLIFLKINLILRFFMVPILWMMLASPFNVSNGILAVAWIALTSTIANCLLFFYFTYKEFPELFKSFSINKLSTSISKKIFLSALPISLELTLLIASFSVFLTIISMIGALEAAISAAVINIIRLVVLPFKSFGLVTGSYAAKCFVQNQTNEGKEWINAGIKLMYILSVPFSILLILSPNTVCHLLTSYDASNAFLPVRIAGLALLLEPLGAFLSRVLVTQGMGKQVLLAGSLFQWLIALPLCFYLGIYLNYGLTMIWLIHFSSRFVFAIGCMIIYRNLLNKYQVAPVYVEA